MFRGCILSAGLCSCSRSSSSYPFTIFHAWRRSKSIFGTTSDWSKHYTNDAVVSRSLLQLYSLQSKTLMVICVMSISAPALSVTCLFFTLQIYSLGSCKQAAVTQSCVAKAVRTSFQNLCFVLALWPDQPFSLRAVEHGVRNGKQICECVCVCVSFTEVLRGGWRSHAVSRQ